MAGEDGEDAHAAQLRQRCAELEASLKSINDERDLLQHIVKKLSDQIETLTEEMFGEANERVSTAERARFDAEVAQAEAEQGRIATEEEMRQVRQRMMKLKRAIEAKQAEIAAKELASKHESAAEYTARFSGRREHAEDGGERTWDAAVDEEFKEFLGSKSRLETRYFERCLEDDILPCVPDKSVLELLATNSLIVEASPTIVEGRCHVSGELGSLTYRMRAATGATDLATEWQFITTPTYHRIVAVGDLYTFIRYLAKGLVRTTEADVFREVTRHRLRVVCARLGWINPKPVKT